MKAADLFINIGITGANTVGKTLGGIQGGLKDVASSSLAAKAAILAAFYGLEKLTGWATNKGMELYKFQIATGMSSMELQKWQHALRLAGVSAEETADYITGLQQSMVKLQLEGGMDRIYKFMKTAGVDFDLKKALDPLNGAFYTARKIQEMLKSPNVPAGVGMFLAKDLGMSMKMIQANKLMNLERDKGNAKDYISIQTQKDLFKINSQFQDMWSHLEAKGANFISKHGKEMVEGFAGLAESAADFAEALASIGEKLEIFKAVRDLIKDVAGAFKDINGYMHGSRSFWGEDLDKNGKVIGDKSATHKMADFFTGKGLADTKDTEKGIYDQAGGVKPLWDSSYWKKNVAPTPAMAGAGAGQGGSVTYNTTLNGYPVEKMDKAANDFVRSIRHAGAMSPAAANRSAKK